MYALGGGASPRASRGYGRIFCGRTHDATSRPSGAPARRTVASTSRATTGGGPVGRPCAPSGLIVNGRGRARGTERRVLRTRPRSALVQPTAAPMPRLASTIRATSVVVHGRPARVRSASSTRRFPGVPRTPPTTAPPAASIALASGVPPIRSIEYGSRKPAAEALDALSTSAVTAQNTVCGRMTRQRRCALGVARAGRMGRTFARSGATASSTAGGSPDGIRRTRSDRDQARPHAAGDVRPDVRHEHHVARRARGQLPGRHSVGPIRRNRRGDPGWVHGTRDVRRAGSQQPRRRGDRPDRRQGRLRGREHAGDRQQRRRGVGPEQGSLARLHERPGSDRLLGSRRWHGRDVHVR